MSEHESTVAVGRGETGAPGGPGAPGAPGGNGTRRSRQEALRQVRASDVEPYTGLGYLSKLFRIIAIFLVLLLVLETATGLYREGTSSLPTLFSEMSRLVVLAGLLWGAGDLATLLIDVGHDVRAARILLARQVTHTVTDRPGDRLAERLAERGAPPDAAPPNPAPPIG